VTKMKNFAIAAGTLALGLATLVTSSMAQGPMYDMVYVNLPYSVTIGAKTLQPGDYVVKELPSQDKSRVLLIYSDHGMKFETSSMTIPAYQVQTPEDTKIVLHHFGNDYYFDKVWIQGKNYGYEFPLPNSVKQREKERLAPVSVAATYQASPTPPQTAEVTPAPAPEPAAAPEPQPEPQQTAQNTPPPQPEVAPEPAPEPSANRELPSTSAGWLLMLLSGGTLSGAGLMLRRRR
jgi:LPXTG-motif cell wall-anchored protein